MNHTPTPWKLSLGTFVVYTNQDAKEEIIATVSESGVREIAITNARFIITCVNSHTALVKALKGIVNLPYVEKDLWDDDGKEALQNVREALALAGEKYELH